MPSTLLSDANDSKCCESRQVTDRENVMKLVLTLISALLCIAVDCAHGALSKDQIDKITVGIQEYRSSWTTQNTVNLLTRSDQNGTSTFTMTTDEGAEISIEVESGETVLIEGEDVADSVKAPDQKHSKGNRLLYACGVLSFLLCLSLLLNVHLIRRQGRKHSYGKTDVINSISRL